MTLFRVVAVKSLTAKTGVVKSFFHFSFNRRLTLTALLSSATKSKSSKMVRTKNNGLMYIINYLKIFSMENLLKMIENLSYHR